jgi:hypothetical protein
VNLERNRVELSGTLVGPLDFSSESDGTPAARGCLRFQARNGTLKIVGFRELAHQLAKFHPGDHVRIVGRICVHPENKMAAVIVDQVQRFDPRQAGAAPSNLLEDIRQVRHEALQVGKRQ